MERTWTILAGMLLLAAPAVQAQFQYTNINGSITITQYTGSGGAVTIPSTLNAVPVTSIGNASFSGEAPVTSVMIPNSVTNIGDYAFEDCTGLTQVTVGSGATSIGDWAFYDCTSLGGIYFQGNAPTADSTVFESHTKVTIHYLLGTSGWGPIFAGINSTQVSYQTLDDPLASRSGGDGTYVQGVSSNNVVGYYLDTNYLYHGFLYNGSTYATLDDPNAISGTYIAGTMAQGVSGGNTVGYYWDGNGKVHGFVYNGNAYTTLDHPNAGTQRGIWSGPQYGTFASAICASNVVGWYVDTNGHSHGFLYTNGTYTTMDDPNASPAYGGTRATGISGKHIVGQYLDASDVTHGFVYDGSTYYTLDNPVARSIDGNNLVGGDLALFGNFVTMDGVLYVAGNPLTLRDPNECSYCGNVQTFLTGISGNTIVGSYNDNGAVSHGFIATVTPNYTIAVSPSPGPGGTVSGAGTFAAGSLQTVAATASSGFAFVNWTVNGDVVNTSFNYTFTLSSNLNLVANFTGGGNEASYQALDDPLAESSSANGTYALGISGANIVGSYNSEYMQGFLYNGSSYTTLDVPNPDYPYTIATGISGGNIVGWYSDGASAHGFLYTNGNYTTLDDPNAGFSGDIPNFPPGGYGYILFRTEDNGYGGTFATGISGRNIVGWYVDDSGYNHGFLYNGSTYTTLDDPHGVGSTYAQGVDGDNIVGWYGDTNGYTHGFLYDGSTYVTLDDPHGIGSTYALAISGGNILGYYQKGFTPQAFLYKGGSYTDLDVPTYATGISGNTVVGFYFGPANTPYGFVADATPGVNYTITLSASPSAGGTVGGGGAFLSGGSRTVTAKANSGYTFASWTENGSTVSSAANYTFTLTGDANLVANFTAHPVNYAIAVMASPSTGGTVSGGGTFASGTSHTVTAKASSGYMFGNWTENGSLVSSAAGYTFTLSANRTLVAHFAVKGNPKLTITSPKFGQTVSNAVLLVAGTVTDGVPVASVWCQVNTNGWVQANGTNNWSAQVTLATGANTFRAYAVDIQGNRSQTVSTSVSCYPWAPLALEIVGPGTVTVTPSEVKQMLQIGKAYSITAKPGKGAVFAGWTGSKASTSSTLGFTMASNLTFTATFRDVEPPVDVILYPGVGRNITNEFITVTGSASDNVGVTNVWCLLINSQTNWLSPQRTNSGFWTNWFVPNVEPELGTNSLQTYAVDDAGLFSKTNNVRFTNSFK